MTDVLLMIYLTVALIFMWKFIGYSRGFVRLLPHVLPSRYYIAMIIVGFGWPLIVALVIFRLLRLAFKILRLAFKQSACVALLLAIASVDADAAFCHRKIDDNIERLSGHRWSWRMIDGRKCWYYSRHILPREDLVWSYTEEEFNSDVDRIIGRKFYRVDDGQLVPVQPDAVGGTED